MVFNKIRISTLLIFLGIFLLYFLTRLLNIMSLPIFTDEAIYIRWSQIAKQDAAWRFISLTDGKQPSFIWITMNIMRIVKDPLLSGRLTSVIAGFCSLLGIMLLSTEIFKKKRNGGILNRIFGQLLENKQIAYLSGLLFIFFPFALVYDRMAMYDSLVMCTMVWALYLEILLVRYLRLDIALIAGVAMGGAMLTKTSGFFSVYLFPFTLLIFDYHKKNLLKNLLKFTLLAVISCVIAFAIYSVLWLSPFVYIINEKNALFVRPFSDWINNPFERLYGNFNAIIPWLITYVSVPIILFAVIGFFIGGKFREKILLVSWFIIPFTALGVFGNILYPRFILFMTTPIIILSAFAISEIINKFKNKVITIIAVFIAISFFLYADYFILFKFTNAPIPNADLGQLINSWPAGGGVKEMVNFFDNESKKGKIFVLTQGTFGSLITNSMEIYLGNNTNIENKGLYPLPEKIPLFLKEKSKIMPTYVVLNDSENPPLGWPISLIAKYRKGIGDRHLSIYKVNP